MSGDEFQQRVYHVMENQDLDSLEKLVMVAHYLYQGNPDRAQIAQSTGLSDTTLDIVERDLVRKDWLVSLPEKKR